LKALEEGLNPTVLKKNGCSVSRGRRLRKYGLTIQLIGGLYPITMDA
jgi:hypothetical protein